MQNQDGDYPGVDGASLAGNKVYIRRLVDNRSLSQRRYSLNVTNTDSNTRTPPRDYIVQTTVSSGSGTVDLLPDSGMVIINKSGPIPIGSDPVVKKAQIILQRANPSNAWTSGGYYRPGETVKYQNKHFTCVVKNSDTSFDTEKWSQSYVHMPSDFNAYDFYTNVAPVIYFDNDTDGVQPSVNCGYNLTTCWSTDSAISAQYRTSTDYRGVYEFLHGIGFTGVQATSILLPVATVDRDLNPGSNSDMKGFTPDGAANLLANWPIEFRRPSVLRVFGHAWEWAGFLNYTKALPEYQGDLSPQNQFTYYFTNQLGGRVYATGFNQEGYFVTAAGLTDLSTGDTTSISDIGNPFAGVDIPTYYPQLTVDNLNVTTTLEFTSGCSVSGAPLFSPEWYTNFRTATETLPGIVTLSAITSVGFSAGTSMAFHNASPPTGWVTVSSPAFNNAAIRIVSSSGGGTGGSTNFDTVFTSSRSSSISLSVGGSVSGHSLVTSEIPSHTHSYSYWSEQGNGGAGGTNFNAVSSPLSSTSGTTGSTGSSSPHSHAFNNPSYSMSGMNFNVKYVDFIVATKS
jgi:hypothetical protein